MTLIFEVKLPSTCPFVSGLVIYDAELLGVYFNISEVTDLEKIKINHLTSMVDLENEGHKYILL